MSDHSTTERNVERGEALFYIEKLSCAYISNQPVLEAQDILIPKRKITVLLGPSGSGKSTLLETLGLMSKTVDKESSSIFFFPTDTEAYNLADIWADNQEAERYRIRMLYYSFIFQSTNLMPNFSALENVGLTELIQNKSESEAYFNAIESLVKNLSVTSLSYEKKPFEFSGGERQRLAFARAINPEFTVLFGDEPTGNLDHFNSVKLMHFIRNFITRQRENASAIIVSHNIPLTLDFADRIIVLTKRENGISTIDPHFVYDRDVIRWNESRRLQLKIQNEIELLLNSDTESYGRILMHLSDNNVPEDFFNEIKESMINQQIMLANDPNLSSEQKNEYQKWLNTRFEEKELLQPAVKEYIRQFSHGEIKKADIKINDVIKTIQDLKFKTAVEGHRDRKDDHTGGIEDQELKGERSLVGSILGFFPWLLLSMPPLISLFFEKTSDFFHAHFTRIRKRTLKTNGADEGDSFSFFSFFFKDIIPKVFYRLCVAWDWVNVRYKLFAKFTLKQSWIPFNAIPHDFKHLFYRNETKELLGKKNKHFWLIVVILFFTFLAIGFSSGSMKYLKDKMEDPFVRSISAPIPGNNRTIDRTIARYNSDSLKNYYRYDTIIAYNKWLAHFQGNLPESPNRGIEGRSIPFNDPLVATILDPDINRSVGEPFLNENDISIVVTRNFLERLECSKDPAFVYKKLTNNRLLPVPIRAVVDKLPGERIDFLATQYFYDNWDALGDRFLYKDNKKLYALAVIDTTQSERFREACEQFFNRYYDEGGYLYVNMIDVYPHQFSHQPMYWLQVSFDFSEDIRQEDIDDLYRQFRASEEIAAFMKETGLNDEELVQSYFPNQQNSRYRRYDYLAVNFYDLSKVEEFAEKFTEDAGIKLEMAKIEQMKNYNFVSKLTSIMSIILIGFSVLMINIFLSNILSTHLNNIKMNIGTFKAFGIDIKRIYIGMMYLFVLLPLMVSLLLAGIAGYAGLVYFVIQWISPFAVEKDLYFDLFNSYTLVSIIVLAIVNYYAFSRIINRIFRQTPGDLIYDRSNKA